MAYSMDFRRVVAAAYEACGSSAEVAAEFGCCAAWVRRLAQRQRETGSLAPKPLKLPDNTKLKEKDLEELRNLIAAKPDMTLGELAAALTTKVSVATVHRATKKLGLPLKKKSTFAAEQDRPDVQEKRATWYEQFRDVRLEQLVFIDEFGAATNMARTRGRGPRGQRVVSKTPHGHWMLIRTIAALDASGICTACSFTGATDTEMFVAFVREFLAPKLTAGQVVVLDNLAAHLSPQVDALMEARGARVLRLPPYSPDFNPIENAISKIKALLRKLARRDVASLLEAIGTGIDSITPADAHNFIKHCKYATDG